jgi:hypothetical protein
VQFERRTEASAQARLLRPDYPETGLEEIDGDLLEADFWPAMTSGLPVRTKPLARRTLRVGEGRGL